jgi:hypothetical protein
MQLDRAQRVRAGQKIHWFLVSKNTDKHVWDLIDIHLFIA